MKIADIDTRAQQGQMQDGDEGQRLRSREAFASLSNRCRELQGRLIHHCEADQLPRMIPTERVEELTDRISIFKVRREQRRLLARNLGRPLTNVEEQEDRDDELLQLECEIEHNQWRQLQHAAGRFYADLYPSNKMVERFDDWLQAEQEDPWYSGQMDGFFDSEDKPQAGQEDPFYSGQMDGFFDSEDKPQAGQEDPWYSGQGMAEYWLRRKERRRNDSVFRQQDKVELDQAETSRD
ncbi:hypothetical protein KC342_g9746 [Hortaea werneckii]|nr:hypothetical protein KC342_g9746 [Hortaea werneckii]KAI7400740.1 hypothetical protein KC328_g3435 [Hortaea werneckii]